MDQYHARKTQMGGGFNLTIPVGVGDASIDLKDVYVPPGVDPTTNTVAYTIHVQRIEMVVVTGSAAKTWAIADDHTPAKPVVGAKSAATSNTRYTFDFGPGGLPLNEGNSLIFTASAAGAIGYIVVEGYQSARNEDFAIQDLDVTSGTTAGGTAVAISVAPAETGATVTFGGIAATVVSIDEANLLVNVTTPAHVAGAVDVVVTNPSHLRTPITAAAAFTYA